MARGASKAQSELLDYRAPNDRAEDSRGQSFEEYEKQAKSVASRFIDDLLNNSEARAWFEDFLTPLTRYQGDRHFKYEGHKERRELIATMFTGLPKYVREFVGMPPETIKFLYRGADHPANPGRDGKINASFSGNPAWAKEFMTDKMRKNFGNQKKYSAPDLYTYKDIESFKDIISIQRTMDLLNAMTVAFSSGGKVPNKELEKRVADAFLELQRGQAEYLVTDIKWKA